MAGHLHPLSFVQRHGPGIPLVLLHAVGLDFGWWDAILSELDPGQPFIAFDLPGHGSSMPIDEAFSIETLADVVHLNLQQLGVERAHFCGHSVGGMIAQALSIRHPSLIASLTLIATAATYDENMRKTLRSRAADVEANGMAPLVQPTLDRWFTTEFRRRRPDVIVRCERTLMLADSLTHARMWRAISELSLLEKLSTLHTPAQVLAGEMDVATPVSGARLIADTIPDARLSVIPGTGHLMTVEAADRVAHEIKVFTCNNEK